MLTPCSLSIYFLEYKNSARLRSMDLKSEIQAKYVGRIGILNYCRRDDSIEDASGPIKAP